MARPKCKWGGGCERDAEYREMINTPSGKSVVWLELCQEHHSRLGEIPVDYVKIEDE